MHDDRVDTSSPHDGPHGEVVEDFLDAVRARTEALTQTHSDRLDPLERTRHISREAVLDTPLWPLLLAMLTLFATALVAYLGVVRFEEHLIAITL